MSPTPANPSIDLPDLLRVQKHSEAAQLPTRGSSQATGYDLYSAKPQIIPARGKALVDTQLLIAIPKGTYGHVTPQSGLASKFSIATGASVIDADYRGIVFVLLFNLGEQDFEICPGDQIAQLVLKCVVMPEVSEVVDLDDSFLPPPTDSPS